MITIYLRQFLECLDMNGKPVGTRVEIRGTCGPLLVTWDGEYFSVTHEASTARVPVKIATFKDACAALFAWEKFPCWDFGKWSDADGVKIGVHVSATRIYKMLKAKER